MGDLKNKTVKGVMWNTIQSLSSKGIQFFFMLFMTRLLSPSDYGMFGMVYIFMAISGTFIDSGFGSALIRKKNRTSVDESTVFYFNIVASTICYIILFFTAPFIGDFYNMPELGRILRVMGLSLVISSFGSIQGLRYTIALNFKTPAIIYTCSNIFSGCIGLVLAYQGYGVWALVWQLVITSLFTATVLIVFQRWRPLWAFSWKSFHEMFSFSSKLLASRLIDTLYKNIYPVFIGKFYNAATLGFYSRAQQIAQFPSINATTAFQSVTYPTLCKLQDDNARLESSYRRLIKVTAFVIFPLMTGLAVIAFPLIRTILGAKWEYSATLLTIICFSMMWYPIHAINLNLLQVKGRSDLFLRLEIIKKILGIGVIIITIPLGIEAMCYGSIISSIFTLVINTYYTDKLIHVGFLKQMCDLRYTFLLCIIMGIFMLSINRFILSSDIIRLIVSIPVGFAIYIGGAKLLNLIEIKEIIDILKRR